MKIDVRDFEEVKAKGEELYKSFTETYCSYFKEKVLFNARGLEHLKFKSFKKTRTEKDQYMRFKLLHLVPEILRLSRTVQGIFETKKFEKVRIHGRTETVFKLVHFYEFIAVMERDRVKVIIKQIGEGEKFFWSLIPSWGMNQTTRTRLLYEGDPEQD